MKCGNCGEGFEPGESFCAACGLPLGTAAAAPPPPPPQPAPAPLPPAKLEYARTAAPAPPIPRPPVHDAPAMGADSLHSSFRTSDDASECRDFGIEYNEGSSLFFSGIGSALQLRITPLSESARKASGLRVLLKFPGEDAFIEDPMPFSSLGKSVVRSINYKPAASVGVRQALDLYFSYLAGETRLFFSAQLTIDIYPGEESREKLLENLTINIGNIVQEGKAGDPRISLMDGLKKNTSKLPDLLAQLKGAPPMWRQVELLFASAPENAPRMPDAAPPPHAMLRNLVLQAVSGARTILCSPDPVLGRRSDCDIVARNLPDPGAVWSQEELKRRNERISGRHCRISMPASGPRIEDLNSTNGTYLDGGRVPPAGSPAPLDGVHELSLGGSGPLAFTVSLSAIAGPSQEGGACRQGGEFSGAVLAKRTDRVPEAYLMLSGRISLQTVCAGAPAGWQICHIGSAFALANGGKLIWLFPGVQLPPKIPLTILPSPDSSKPSQNKTEKFDMEQFNRRQDR